MSDSVTDLMGENVPAKICATERQKSSQQIKIKFNLKQTKNEVSSLPPESMTEVMPENSNERLSDRLKEKISDTSHQKILDTSSQKMSDSLTLSDSSPQIMLEVSTSKMLGTSSPEMSDSVTVEAPDISAAQVSSPMVKLTATAQLSYSSAIRQCDILSESPSIICRSIAYEIIENASKTGSTIPIIISINSEDDESNDEVDPLKIDNEELEESSQPSEESLDEEGSNISCQGLDGGEVQPSPCSTITIISDSEDEPLSQLARSKRSKQRPSKSANSYQISSLKELSKFRCRSFVMLDNNDVHRHIVKTSKSLKVDLGKRLSSGEIIQKFSSESVNRSNKKTSGSASTLNKNDENCCINIYTILHENEKQQTVVDDPKPSDLKNPIIEYQSSIENAVQKMPSTTSIATMNDQAKTLPPNRNGIPNAVTRTPEKICDGSSPSLKSLTDVSPSEIEILLSITDANSSQGESVQKHIFTCTK